MISGLGLVTVSETPHLSQSSSKLESFNSKNFIMNLDKELFNELSALPKPCFLSSASKVDKQSLSVALMHTRTSFNLSKCRVCVRGKKNIKEVKLGVTKNFNL